MMNQKLE